MAQTNNINYMHGDTIECDAFCAKVRSLARNKSDGCFAVFEFATKTGTPHALEAAPLKKAEAELFDLLITHTKNNDLLSTLNKRYEDKGIEAIRYIR